MIYVPICKKPVEQMFTILTVICLVNSLNFKFGQSLEHLNFCPTLDHRFFTLGEPMPLDGFIQQQSYLGRWAFSCDDGVV